MLSTVVGIVESALEIVFSVEGRIDFIFFERSSSTCCRRSSLLLKVRSSSSLASKVVLFFERSSSFSELKVVFILALEFVFGVQGRTIFFERSSLSLLSTVVEIVESSLKFVFGFGARLRVFAGFVVFLHLARFV